MQELEVVWNGTMDRDASCPSLVANRETKLQGSWIAPPRLYNKSGRYTLKGKCELNPTASRVCERGSVGCEIVHRKQVKPESVKIVNIFEED